MTIYRRRIPGLNSEQVMHAMGIDDAYRVERELARGRLGVTELVTIEDAGPFVRKKIPKNIADRMVWAALAQTTCPRLSQVVATYEMPDCFVAVYDFMPGDSLKEVLERCGSLDARDAVRLAQDVCDAVAALHELGIMHLDIAPGNIVLAADGAHVIDMGNARMIGSQAPPRASGERPLGTWGFAAPEQFFSKADARSDVYAIGRLLSAMLTGALPQEGNAEAYEQGLEREVPISPTLAAVIERATAFEPSARYQTVQELLSDLEVIESEGGEGGFSGASEASGSSPATGVPATAGAPGVAGASAAAGAPGVAAVPASADAPAGDPRSIASPAADESPVPGTPSRHRRSTVFVAGIISMTVVVLVAIAIIAARLFSRDADAFAQNGRLSVDHITSVSPGNADEGDEGDGDDGATDAGIDSSTIGATSSDVARAQEALEIVESGWSVSDSGYVHYALAFSNTSDDLTIEYPEILITGRDADGAIVFADTQVLSVIFPGQTFVYGSQAGNGTKPATVEFALGRLQDYGVHKERGRASVFEVKNLKEGRSSLDSPSFTGEVTFIEKGDEPLPSGDIRLSLILRDGDGRIVFGETGFVTCPAEGESVPFEITPHGCPEYATAEVVALAW